MVIILHDLLLFTCLAAFVTVIVIAAASLLKLECIHRSAVAGLARAVPDRQGDGL